jgi:hypothetical protein
VTFSDARVVGLLREKLIPVWESVAPVSVAVFDLGDGRTVRGTMGGEIAIYFCRPDGRVFDVLPALHSPHATYWAIKNALDFYEATGATDEAIRRHHAAKALEMSLKGLGRETPEIARSKRHVKLKDGADPGTKALGKMVYSKSGVGAPEPVTVVEPGGLDYYKRKVHEALAASAPKTPAEWKVPIFEQILDMKLVGGEFDYNVDTLAPIDLIDE